MATGDERHLQALALLDAWLLDQLTPDIYDDGSPENVLTLARRRFGQTCAALAEQGFPRAQELTLFDFHSAIDYLTSKRQDS